MGWPRGRPRRPRLSRMDAAVDAMLPLGFPEAVVKKRAKQLLTVYGGDEGWPFIEECSYKVLLDSLLEERDDEEQDTQNGLLLMPAENQALSDKPQGDEEPSCSRASDALIEPPSEAVAEDTPLPASSPPRDNTPLLLLPANGRTCDEEPSCSRASDALIEPPSEAVAEDTPLPAPSPPRDSTPLLLLPANGRARFPCYGWIESDDEDDADEFINVTPASAAIATLNVPPWRKKRSSRWDVKPGDP